MPCCEQGVAKDTTSAFKHVCLARDYVENYGKVPQWNGKTPESTQNVLLSDEPKLQTVWHKTSKPPLKSEDEDFTSIKEGLQKRKNN